MLMELLQLQFQVNIIQKMQDGANSGLDQIVAANRAGIQFNLLEQQQVLNADGTVATLKLLLQ